MNKIKIYKKEPQVITGLCLLLTVMPVLGEKVPPIRALRKDKIGFVKVAEDNWTFVDTATGKTFIPLGCNYYDASTGWPPQVWKNFNEDRIKRDFAKMKELEINVARVAVLTGQPWVQRVGPFQFKANEDTLVNFSKLIEIARTYNIRLILSQFYWEGYPRGLGNPFSDKEALQYQEFGYRILARLAQSEPIVFAYTLMNEPRNVWNNPAMFEKWNIWLKEKYVSRDALKDNWQDLKPAESFGSIKIPENKDNLNSPRLYDYQLFRKSIAFQWTKRMVDAIRQEDKNHLVSLGNVQWAVPFDRERLPGGYTAFDPRELTELLDFICIHYYPFSPHHPQPLTWTSSESEDAFTDWLYSLEAFIRFSYVGKPVLLEEFNFGLTPRGKRISDPDTLMLIARWNKAVIEHTINCASGWLSWPFQDTTTATDISNAGGLIDSKDAVKPWGKAFGDLARSIKSKKLQRAAGDKIMEIDEKKLLTSANELKKFWHNYLKLRREGITVEFSVRSPRSVRTPREDKIIPNKVNSRAGWKQ